MGAHKPAVKTEMATHGCRVPEQEPDRRVCHPAAGNFSAGYGRGCVARTQRRKSTTAPAESRPLCSAAFAEGIPMKSPAKNSHALPLKSSSFNRARDVIASHRPPRGQGTECPGPAHDSHKESRTAHSGKIFQAFCESPPDNLFVAQRKELLCRMVNCDGIKKCLPGRNCFRRKNRSVAHAGDERPDHAGKPNGIPVAWQGAGIKTEEDPAAS